MLESPHYLELDNNSHWPPEGSLNEVPIHLGWQHKHERLGESFQSFHDNMGHLKPQIRARLSSILKLVRAIPTAEAEADL